MIQDTESDTKSAFAGFTGFSKTVTPATTFSFLSNSSNPPAKSNINGSNRNAAKPEVDKKLDEPVVVVNNKPPFTGLEPSNPVSRETKGKSNDYYSKLKGLNESVSNWIKKHVDSNPLINLQPIFKDYERYFNDLEKERDNAENEIIDAKKVTENTTSINSFVFKAAKNVPEATLGKAGPEVSKANSKSVTPQFSFGASSMVNTSPDSIPKFGFSSTNTSNTFSFGCSTSTSKSSVTPSFSFGGNVSTAVTAGFSFTNSTPFTFSNASQPASNNGAEKQKDSDDEDEPPKVEFTPVVEKDHVFTTRCKVFVKKDASFGDRGVGNLYIKPIDNSEKMQLIVRADTNLGNLLCNFILSESIPIKRMGKKDVMLVCLPTPDFKPPPVPILFRVKSSDEADNLLKVLEKHKK
ncbi:hypothetical protein NQ315_003874 [Exocentrus adspersus]|uniref:RanBD1 domain-containing protein n=1 Tax=Exocentrus adspersus TaxID=1586481 RepID=A0AAV8VYT4_9CUCU|nr:hypothetical protein NQ315_003874 [Exocentrus adspersus]